VILRDDSSTVGATPASRADLQVSPIEPTVDQASSRVQRRSSFVEGRAAARRRWRWTTAVTGVDMSPLGEDRVSRSETPCPRSRSSSPIRAIERVAFQFLQRNADSRARRGASAKVRRSRIRKPRRRRVTRSELSEKFPDRGGCERRHGVPSHEFAPGDGGARVTARTSDTSGAATASTSSGNDSRRTQKSRLASFCAVGTTGVLSPLDIQTAT